MTRAQSFLEATRMTYKPNHDWDVSVGETLGGGNTGYPKFKSKIKIDCWVDTTYGMNHYTAHGEDPKDASTKIYGSAEDAHGVLTK